MSKKEEEILETFGKIIPNLTEIGKEKLLSYGEGYADGIRARRNLSNAFAAKEPDKVLV